MWICFCHLFSSAVCNSQYIFFFVWLVTSDYVLTYYWKFICNNDFRPRMTVHPYRKYSHLLLTNAWRWYLSNTTLIQIQSFTEHPNDGYIDYKSMQGLVTASSPLSWKGSYSESQFEVVGRLVTFPTCLGLGLQLLSLFLMRAPQPELSLTTPLWLLNCPQGKMTFLARLPPLGSFLLLDFSLTILGCFFVFILPLPFFEILLTYVSLMCTTWVFDKCIYCEMITTKRLVDISMVVQIV